MGRAPAGPRKPALATLPALNRHARAIQTACALAPWAFSDRPRRPTHRHGTYLTFDYDRPLPEIHLGLHDPADRIRWYAWQLPSARTLDPALPAPVQARADGPRWFACIARWLARWEARATAHADAARHDPALATIRARVAAHQLAGCCDLARSEHPALAPLRALVCDLAARTRDHEQAMIPTRTPAAHVIVTRARGRLPLVQLYREDAPRALWLNEAVRWEGWSRPPLPCTSWRALAELWDALVTAPVRPLHGGTR